MALRTSEQILRQKERQRQEEREGPCLGPAVEAVRKVGFISCLTDDGVPLSSEWS